MSTLARGSIKMAFDSVRETRWRSMLTMFGVITGIVSVVMIVGIGEGVKQEVARQINQFGKDLITVRPGSTEESKRGLKLANTDLLFGLGTVGGLTLNDLRAVHGAAHVGLAAPLGVVPGSVHVGNRTLEPALVVATTPELPFLLNRSVAYGDFFTAPEENSNYAVIGQSVAHKLFEDEAPLGQSLNFRGQSFIVRGVFDDFRITPLSPTTDFNDAIFIPLSVAERLTGSSLQIYSILAKPDKPSNIQPSVRAITQALLKSHGGEKDFSVLDQEHNLAASSSVLSLLTAMIAAVAAISLLVGGVGVMNIMLATVTERTHEIGVRKAIGATNRQIMSQFVLESVVLSLVGGIAGILISMLSVVLIGLYTDFKPVLSWEAIAVATGVSLIIGVVFGAVPAIRAARKDPIEALRYE